MSSVEVMDSVYRLSAHSSRVNRARTLSISGWSAKPDTVLDRIGSISYTRWRNEAFHPIDLWDASVD